MAIRTTTRKSGRPACFYRASDGTRYDGLTRNAAGRWRISATGETFREPIEARAIARYLEVLEQQVPVVRVTSSAKVPTIAAGRQRVRKLLRHGSQVLVRRGDHWELRLTTPLEEAAYWERVKHDLLERPELCAAKTGIAALAWLPEMKKPAPSSTLKELGQLYQEQSEMSPHEMSRSVLVWEQFVKAVGVSSVKEITHDLIAAYHRKMKQEGYAPKTLTHRFAKVRGVLRYAIKRGRSVAECRNALDFCAQLEVKAPAPVDPHPIQPEHFWTLYDQAKQAGDHVFAALMLTALNAGMYGSEVAALTWAEVDLPAGELVSRRNKTGISRIAVLWPETVAALKALPQDRETIFNTRVRSYTTYSVTEVWARYRTAAGMPKSVTFSHLRDAAYSLALKVSWEQAEMLAGHKLPGTSDNYLRRNPRLVHDARQAIREEYVAVACPWPVAPSPAMA